MEKQLRIPLIFLFVGSMIGVLLRTTALWPTGITYSFFLHGHSHVMFLGWLFNVFFLVYVGQFVPKEKQRGFRYIFASLQVANLGMLIAFPLQGYGAYSIFFSTLHTILAGLFIFSFRRYTSSQQSDALLLANYSLLFFAVSAIGPFALAFIMANDLQHTHWYQYAIYFYLHFQYNGFFLFGIGSLFIHAVTRSGSIQTAPFIRAGNLIAIATVPTYFLSILYSKPSLIVYLIGFGGAVLQLVAFLRIYRWLQHNQKTIAGFSGLYSTFGKLLLGMLAAKLTLQLISSLPVVADFAYAYRPLIIGYLHLVLVGLITSFLLLWYNGNGNFKKGFVPLYTVFIINFLVMELILFLTPLFSASGNMLIPTYGLLGTAVLLSLCCLAFVFLYRNPDKSHLLP